MVPSVYKINASITENVFIMPKPSGEWLEDDMRYYDSLGITHIVSLLTRSEVHELGLNMEEECCKTVNINFTNFEIEDRGLPEAQKFSSLIRHLAQTLLEGQTIAIHCRAGIGRAGLTASCLLIEMGVSTLAAIDYVSTARRVEIPDTKEQREFILNYPSKLPQ